MYRLTMIILMSLSAAYGMHTHNTVCKKWPVVLEEIGIERGVSFVTEMCSKLGEICPDTWDNPSNYECRYTPYCAITQSAAILSFDIIHASSRQIVCAFKYNTLTQDLTKDDNPDFLWKVQYKN